MKTLFFLFAMALSTIAEGAWKLKFSYLSNSEESITPCSYYQINDLPDYTVKCGSKERTYSVHLIARKSNRSEEPQTVMEILYWVTAPGDTPTSVRKYHSTSAILRLKQQSDLQELILDQGIENDMAALRLEISDFR